MDMIWLVRSSCFIKLSKMSLFGHLKGYYILFSPLVGKPHRFCWHLLAERLFSNVDATCGNNLNTFERPKNNTRQKGQAVLFSKMERSTLPQRQLEEYFGILETFETRQFFFLNSECCLGSFQACSLALYLQDYWSVPSQREQPPLQGSPPSHPCLGSQTTFPRVGQCVVPVARAHMIDDNCWHRILFSFIMFFKV